LHDADEGHNKRRISESVSSQDQLLEVQSKPMYDYFDSDSTIAIPHDSDRDREEMAQETRKSSNEAC
jgi:hypothetical protein